MNNIIIFEVNLTGHHGIYLEKIIKTYLKAGDKVTVVISANYKKNTFFNNFITNDLFSIKACDYEYSFLSKLLHLFLPNVAREFNFWSKFQKEYNKLNLAKDIDFVFLPYADYCLYAIAFLGSPFQKSLWSGICMRPSFHLPFYETNVPNSFIKILKEKLFRYLLRTSQLKCLFTIDPLLFDFVKNNPRYNKSRKLFFLSDPADKSIFIDINKTKRQYGFKKASKIILVYGFIDKRKGLFDLLDTLRINRSLTDWHVLIVGNQSEEVKKELLIEKWNSLMKEKRIFEVSKFVNAKIEQEVFEIANVIWIAYESHEQMSGVLVRAGMHSKPVLAYNYGLIGWYVKHFNLGLCSKSKKVGDISKALKMLKTKNNRQRLGLNGFNLFAANTWSNFEKTLIFTRERAYEISKNI